MWYGRMVYGNPVDRPSFFSSPGSETDRTLLPLDVSHLRMRRLSGTADAAAYLHPFLETRSYLYAVHLSGGIYKRYSTSVQERMSLEL